MLPDNTIRKGVMKVVEMRIAGAQKEFDAECKRLEEKLKDDKKSLADRIVGEVIGKAL
jgi:F0F1-type ATP synthase membrane subunit b/b'